MTGNVLMDLVALIIRVDIMDNVAPLHHHLYVSAIRTVLKGNVALTMVYVVTVLKLQLQLQLHLILNLNVPTTGNVLMGLVARILIPVQKMDIVSSRILWIYLLSLLSGGAVTTTTPHPNSTTTTTTPPRNISKMSRLCSFFFFYY